MVFGDVVFEAVPKGPPMFLRQTLVGVPFLELALLFFFFVFVCCFFLGGGGWGGGPRVWTSPDWVEDLVFETALVS